MKVKLSFDKDGYGSCIVVKQKGDPKYYGIKNSKGESLFLHHVKEELNLQGYDFIKKRMKADGLLADQNQFYIRERKAKNGRRLAIWNCFWPFEGAETNFNKLGKSCLAVFNLLEDQGE